MDESRLSRLIWLKLHAGAISLSAPLDSWEGWSPGHLRCEACDEPIVVHDCYVSELGAIKLPRIFHRQCADLIAGERRRRAARFGTSLAGRIIFFRRQAPRPGAVVPLRPANPS